MIPIYRPTRVLVQFQDAKGNISGTAVRLLAGIPFDVAGDFGEGWAGAMEPASDAKVIGIQIIAETAPAYSGRPGPSSDCTRVGTLIFGTADPDERVVVEIPSVRPELLLTSGPYAGVGIDLTLPEVLAITNLIVGGDGTVEPTGLTGNDLTSVITGLLRIP